MYFLSINKIKPVTDPAVIKEVIHSHIQWTKKMILHGKIVQAGKWGKEGGMAVFKASDIATAKMMLNEDPIVKSGLVTLEIEQFFPDVEIR